MSAFSYQIVVTGVGGRGVLMISRILSELALSKGFGVKGSDELGMSQRGGSVSSFVKIGDFSSPVIGSGCADIIVAMESDEGLRNLPFLKEGGYFFLHLPNKAGIPPEILRMLKKMGAKCYFVNCDSISLRVGNPRVSNMAMMGLVWKAGVLPFSRDDFFSVLERVVPGRFLEANLRAFELGLREGRVIL